MCHVARLSEDDPDAAHNFLLQFYAGPSYEQRDVPRGSPVGRRLGCRTQFLNLKFMQDQAINSDMFQEAALSEYDS